MSDYRIIDEPRPRFSTQLIVNPVAILFVAVFLPILFVPPYQGRLWIPFLWLVINGILLGSPTLKKEIILAVVGLCLTFYLPLLIYMLLAYINMADDWQFFLPYIQIARHAVFFFFLYLIINAQTVPYAIHQYLKEQHS